MDAASWRSRYDLLCAGLALALGLGIGWLDLHVTEVVVTIAALLLAGALLGLLRPAGAWRWAVLLALGLPVVESLGLALGAHSAEPIRLDPRIALVAFAFAVAGCYAGALIRWLAGLASSG